ncbi:error-prone DNA polymerase [uncultured Methylibium sp.]|uniref:error-prone DNA polymerase n=1 Tax=uncultured Methylibium sp. TaxID=381093 RepID=UPI0025FD96F7|nr:error-prone DNA polymerase [uncultured Methylibium sp.]
MPQPAHPKAPRPAPPPEPPPQVNASGLPAYAELHCRSNFSFLTGASHPSELVQRAAQLGYDAIAITDECSVAGVVRAHDAWKALPADGRPLKLLIGAEFTLEATSDEPGLRLVLIAKNRDGYAQLSGLITRGRQRSSKGSYRLATDDLDALLAGAGHPPGLPDCLALLIPQREDDEAALSAQARALARRFGEHASIAVELLRWADDDAWVAGLLALSAASGLPLVAAGDVRMHARSRKALLDTLAAIRLKRPLADCGLALPRNGEQHLRPRSTLARLYREAWMARSVALAQRCSFDLRELRYEYPAEITPPGVGAAEHLRSLTEDGARRRYPDGVPASVHAQIEHELALITRKRYEAFFLTVHDIVRHARSQGILCQGRGSAANSAVCYCLGITAVDPTRTTLLFERFISEERDEAPDIDVDFEHERRETVIQYVYGKYGRHRTALAAALITYRVRSAVRDVGKALGFDEQRIARLARSHQWFDDAEKLDQRLRENGFDPGSPLTRQWLELSATLHGFPRHLSQHVGGFVIARDELSRMVPVENAAMPDRQVIQWDKDDLESLGLLKVDVLALGMLTMLRRGFGFLRQLRGRDWGLADVPQDDPATYAMICRADTAGVFQIESRAQQSMLPRLRPREFYDLVVEVAIVRPGPISGGMVHPYLKQRELQRRRQLPAPAYPALWEALKRTLGVPIFQEQVIQICMIAADFSGGEADELRRAMAAWKRKGGVHHFHQRIVSRMVGKGYDAAFAENIFKQITGFGEYGFPESHAYSFALLAYVSAWLKCHEPAVFLAALLNSQPMGFYSPSQLVQDAKRHDIEVRAVDVCHSDWDCTLEPEPASSQPAVRLGLRLVKGFNADAAGRLMAARTHAPFSGLDDLALRAALDPQELQCLARADALIGLAGHRRQQAWLAAGQARFTALLADAPQPDEPLALPPAPEGQEIRLDYASTGLTLRRHPVALLRPQLARRGWRHAEDLARLRDGASAWACGIVVMRQQPETANGTIFVTLEDETGSVNVIVWRHVRERYRQALLASRLLAVAGQWQKTPEGVMHLVARRLVDVTPWLGRLGTSSRDFH